MQTSHIKRRNMVVQGLLVIVTLGIYAIYWFHVTLNELHKANGKAEGAGMWTFLSIIPLVQLFAYWHYSFEYARFVDDKYPGIAIFILWIVFSPVVWFLVQSDLTGRQASRVDEWEPNRVLSPAMAAGARASNSKPRGAGTTLAGSAQ